MRNDTEKAGTYVLKSYGQLFKKQHQELLAVSEYSNWEPNRTFLAIQLYTDPKENIAVTDLVSSDNAFISKILSVLSSLCIEVMELKKEAFQSHFPYLSVYEEYNESEINCQIQAICKLSAFVTRCDDVLRNLCNQMFAIFEENFNVYGLQWHYTIKHVGEIFTILALTELLISNTSLPSKWRNYRKILHAINQEPEKVDMFEEKFKALIGAVDNITTKLMNDDIVQTSLQNLLTLRNRLVNKNSSMLTSEFIKYIRLGISNLDSLVQDKPNVNNMYKCIKVNALYVFTSHLFGISDKKVFKSLIELNTKVHSVNLTGTSMWFPEQFLQRHVPSQCATYGKLSQTMLKARQAYINSKKASLARDIVCLQTECTQWVLNVEHIFSSNHHRLSAAEMSLHAKTLLEGLEISSNVNNTVTSLINLHLSLGVPLSKNMLMSLFEIIDMLKCLQNVVTRNHYQIINSINMIVQHLTFQVTSYIQDLKKTLVADKTFANKRLDELTCIVIAEQSLKGAATIDRNIAANIALSFVPDTTYLEDGYARLAILLEKIQTLSNFFVTFESYCNCSWILWHQNVIPIYFDQNFNTQLSVLKLKYFLMVLEDCAFLLHKTDGQYGLRKSDNFLRNMEKLVDDKVIKCTSQNIETNLRLHIHSHLQLDATNPFVFDMTKKILLAIDSYRLMSVYMAVVPSVEHYLSTMYYNLTTVVLSDWKTYGEMRQMAKFKFNLDTVQDNLPTQTLEQGLDVLEIMRNIHVFVSKYLYNLNNQIFIEKSSNNKHLNSINIGHVANSIRTHGTGIMNTTVNFTYQFLKKKFFTFSQFMYDEHIKSRLAKDLRNFKEAALVNNGMYPYKNAEKFNKGIKVLGIAEDGQSYLDLFRDLISQIGNAIGYVRMIRSGGRHCCSDATAFLPVLEDIKLFKDMCEEVNLDPNTIHAAENLDHNINVLVTNFIQGTEYFKLLVDVFAPVFRNPKNIHLKNFFIIVPPLTLNFVEHMILSKDKMTKKNKIGAAFTDDGFAMGIAYILKLLDQDSSFESLHWFDSVWKHIQEERKTVEEQKKGSIQLQQTLALTEKKIKTVEEEFKLLYYSLTSARIFFR